MNDAIGEICFVGKAMVQSAKGVVFRLFCVVVVSPLLCGVLQYVLEEHSSHWQCH